MSRAKLNPLDWARMPGALALVADAWSPLDDDLLQLFHLQQAELHLLIEWARRDKE
jgi:hypothetical protein